jgi:mono/diheme cytochrome c family protein
MRKRLMKIAAWVAVVVAAVASLLVAVVQIRWQRTFDAPYPEIHASSDPAVIGRGRYLVYGPAHCVACHTNNDEQEAIKAGAMPPLAGGGRFSFPLGSFWTPNLTPDVETGVARFSDGELARVLRHGVMPDGRAALPFMEFHDLSEEDLTAVISFLRSQPAVRRAVPQHHYTFLGKAVMAFLIKPIGPSKPVRAKSPAEEATVERGAYLANNVAGCVECHTRRSEVDGHYVGAPFSGGNVFPVEGDPNTILVTPNLTPSQTGRITSWPEEQFVGRFGVGAGVPHTHMPWRLYQRMSDTDVRAIYRYLRSLPPSNNDPGPTVQRKDRKREAERTASGKRSRSAVRG